jgi:hypothetical protein
MDGVVEQASEDELCSAAARADRTGLYVCPHTAVALAAAEKLAANGTIGRDESVVVVSTASALKFTEFKVRYHERALPDVNSVYANPPLELPADTARVRGAAPSRRWGAPGHDDRRVGVSRREGRGRSSRIPSTPPGCGPSAITVKICKNLARGLWPDHDSATTSPANQT